MDKIDEILSEDRFSQINDELKSNRFEKICLNLSEIEDNERIIIDIPGGSFSNNFHAQ